jgi:hypothetical protein
MSAYKAIAFFGALFRSRYPGHDYTGGIMFDRPPQLDLVGDAIDEKSIKIKIMHKNQLLTESVLRFCGTHFQAEIKGKKRWLMKGFKRQSKSGQTYLQLVVEDMENRPF